jgi:hypothetical protein
MQSCPTWHWITAAVGALGAAIYDPNPMCWFSIGCGVLLLLSCLRLGFLEAWVLIFVAGGLVVFFAGSARYLLPIAAPIAILASRAITTRIAVVSLGLQFAISLGLATVNYQHWDGYRQFARTLALQVAQHRNPLHTWINAEWGLLFYLESEGGLALSKKQEIVPGDLVVSSELALPIATNVLTAPLAFSEIQSPIPLRITSLDSRSAYSVSNRGVRAFEFSLAPLDRVRADLAIERKPVLTWITPQDRPQIVSGWFPDGWMEAEATVLVKRVAAPLRAEFVIHPQARARHVEMLVDGKLAAEQTFTGPGSYTLSIPPVEGGEGVTVTLRVDQTFSVPPDQRKLGIVVSGIGFRPRP